LTDHGPHFLSLDFHIRFFPAVVWRQVRPSRTTESPFAHHLPIEYPLMLALSLMLAFFGVSSLVLRHSVIGGIVGTLGISGTVALVGQSIWAERGTPLTFEAFRVMVFLFFTILGLTLGSLAGWSASHSRAIEASGAVVGLLAGYALGVAAGLWVQRLGWVAAWFELAAGLAVVGVVVVDLALLFG
jgi:hypothetical protein